MADKNFNVWNSFTQGMGIADNFRRMQDEERQRRMLAMQDQAMQGLSEQPYIPGYEGVQGAEMVPWLRDLIKVNPEMGLQFGNQVAQPFAINREIDKAGKIEKAKREADQAVTLDTMREYYKMRGGGPGAMPVSGGSVNGLPQGGSPGYGGLSGDEASFESGPQGFKFGVKSLSDMERATKAHDMQMKDEELGLKKEDQILSKARFNEDLGKNEQEGLNRLHQQSIAVSQQLRELEKAKNAGEMTPQAFMNEANGLLEQKRAIHAQRDVILRGQQQTKDIANIPSNQYRNEQSTIPQSVVPQTKGTMAPVPTSPQATSQPRARSAQPAPSPQVGAGLPYTLQNQVAKQATQDKISIANKAIEEAHAGALKAESLNDSVTRMLGIVNDGVGSTAMGALPWGIGESIMAIGHDNKRLQSLSNQLIEAYKTEGQTKAFDTLPELKIVASRIPSLDKGEDQNREDMAGVVNLMDARRVSGNFLEGWAKTHGGTLDGAREVLREWMQHNPRMTTENINGRVKIKDNEGYIPMDVWGRLKQRFSTADIVKKREAGHIQVINGRAFLKE